MKNKSVADYVAEHLEAQESAMTSDSEQATATTNSDSDNFNDAELAATINPERLNALLQECDSFLALAEQDMADFENIDDADKENKETGTSEPPAPVNNDNN